jgi:fatty-acyl-CoA synthase
LPALEDYKVQCIVGSPGGFENLLRWFDTLPSYQSNFDVLICGGDVLSQSLSQRLRLRICTHLIASYGSTEASMSATAHAEEIYESPRAVGFVTPGVAIQIVDAHGTVLPFGKEGLVRVRSDYAVSEYFCNEKESAKTFRDGWFYPGDLGTLGADGLLTITGREQTVLNLGGDKINPETIELVLAKFKGVSEAAAFSMANEFGNNEIHAIIVSTNKIDVDALRGHCEARISRPFVPVNYFFADALPHNEMGKIDRQRLQEIVRQIVKNHLV